MAVRAYAVAGVVDSQIEDVFENQHLVGQIKTYTKTLTFTDLATGGKPDIIPAEAGKQWRVIMLRSGLGTNFDAGGDRNIQISSNNSVGPIWAVLIATSLKALATKLWNASGGFSVNAEADAVSAVGDGIFASYAGGATDYTAGEIKIILTVERIA